MERRCIEQGGIDAAAEMAQLCTSFQDGIDHLADEFAREGYKAAFGVDVCRPVQSLVEGEGRHARLLRLLPKVHFIGSTRLAGIEDHTVNLEHVYTGRRTSLRIDTVILVTSKPPEDVLYHALVGQVPELHLIGDARESRWSVFATDEAIKDGRRVGLLL